MKPVFFSALAAGLALPALAETVAVVVDSAVVVMVANDPVAVVVEPIEIDPVAVAEKVPVRVPPNNDFLRTMTQDTPTYFN